MIDGVSVIICCYNSAGRIENVLNYISKQRNTKKFQWEVILVNNASTDNTDEVARRSWTRKDVQLKIVNENKPGLSYARKKGLITSSFSIVIFVDDDNLICDTYVYKAFQIMSKDSNIGLAGGKGIPISDTDFPSWFSNYHQSYALGPQAEQNGYVPLTRTYLYGAGLIMRKKVWDKLISNGFKPILSGREGKTLSSGEDFEISAVFRIAGYQLWYDSNLEFMHIMPASRLKWDYVIRLSHEFGKASVIHDLYRCRVRNLIGWNRLKSCSWIISNLICIRNILELLPSYIGIKTKNIEGNSKECKMNYLYGSLIQRFKLIYRYREIKNEIYRINYMN